MAKKPPKIESIKCHKIVNSRGEWTIETHLKLTDGVIGIQTIPNGASKGEHEAVYVTADKAVSLVEGPINDMLHGENPFDQFRIDNLMLEMDGTSNKKNIGGNSILSVSLATAKACAESKNTKLYEYLRSLFVDTFAGSLARDSFSFPTPLFNVLNGGKHANNGLSFQEFMVIPSQKLTFDKAMELGVSVYHLLEDLLESRDISTEVGDEGGFAPKGLTVRKALNLLKEAVQTEYNLGQDLFLGMDVAATSFFGEDKYTIAEENRTLNHIDMSKFYGDLLKDFPIIYLEDPFYEGDIKGWKLLSRDFNNKVLIVGDDLVVTNSNFLKKIIESNLINAVIVKPNQVGTLSETFEFIKMAQDANLSVILSHRSGDTAEDTFIADLALAVNADFIKSGAPARGERVAKYNRLLEIFDSIS